MSLNLSKEEITESLRRFVLRRDDLLHEDPAAFEHNLERFVSFCENDKLVQFALQHVTQDASVDPHRWWETVSNDREFQFPDDPDSELTLRYSILKSLVDNPRLVLKFGFTVGRAKRDDAIQLFRTLVIRPFVDELSYRLSRAANMATPEERALQAVPLSRIPSATETRIFLSHKSVDKPIVYRYYNALRELGFEPWLDVPDLPAGSNLERGILQGFEESCAAVFFITENFKDEKYLATEVDYAVIQKRNKGDKFVIITLRYPNSSPVPGLLTPYVYKDVANDLQGFHELLRALPIELGPIRWKAHVVDRG